MEEPKYRISVDSTTGLVIGDHNTVIQHFTANIKIFSVDFATRVQNFLAEYLGTNKNPIPFGGREDDISFLDNWFQDLQSPPYLFLAAPAGRGKSTLLVRWIQKMQARNDLVVIFFPISIRFRTNLASIVFSALTSHLAILHGKKVPENPDTPLEVWRALFSDYLSRPLPDGRRLLLVIDGLDEAADWDISSDLFPLDPPEGLRVVLSARYLAGDTGTSSWLRRVGWDRTSAAHTLELNPLTIEGVADVLQRMGFPLASLGLRADIIAELHRLSKGDPLLIRLYVDDLWSRGSAAASLRAAELRSIRPGLEGYFDTWWKEQRILWGNTAPLREPAVQEFFSLLSCALGPLSKEDVLHVARPEAKLTGLMLEEVLIPLNRFVIGDGRQLGYTFSHPRLGTYFYEEKLTKLERQALEGRFMAWGSETISSITAGNILPDQASSYIVQYYGAHLERTDSSIERLLPLVSNDWRRAWEALDVTYSGFLSDTERAWRAAEKVGEIACSAECLIPHLAGEIHCALCQASVNSCSKILPPELVVNLVSTGIWTPVQGLAYASLLANPEQKDESLALLMPYVTRPLETIRLIKSEIWQIEALKILAEIGHLYEAIQATYAIKSATHQAEALAKIALLLPEKQLQEAMKRVQTNRDVEHKEEVQARIAFALSEKRLHEAKEALQKESQAKRQGEKVLHYESLLKNGLNKARAFKNEGYRIDALSWIFPHLTEELKADILQEFLPKSRSYQNDQFLGYKTKALARVAPHLSKKLLKVALESTQTILPEREMVEVLVVLAPELIRVGFLQEVVAIADKISDQESGIRLLQELIPLLPHALKKRALQKVREAIQFLEEEVDDDIEREWIEDNEAEDWAELQTATAVCLAELGNHQEALHLVQKVKSKERRVQMLVKLVPLLPAMLKRNILLESLQLAREVKDKSEQVTALASLVSLLTEKNHTHEAIRIVEAMKEKYSQGKPLNKLIEMGYPLKDLTNLTYCLANLGRPLEALEMVRDIDEKYQALSLTGLASLLPEPLLDDALKIAVEIQDYEGQTQVLTALAVQLSKFGRIQDALGLVRSIKVQMYQEKALAALALDLAKLGYLQEALKAAKAIGSDYSRAKSLTALITQLVELGYTREALDFVSAIEDEELFAKTIGQIASMLPKSLLSKVLKIIQDMSSKHWQAQARVRLIPYLSEMRQREALDILQDIEDDEYMTKVLIETVSSLSRPLLEQALMIIKAMKSEYWQARALAGMATQFIEGGYLREILDNLRGFGNQFHQSMVLLKVIPFSPKTHLKELLDVARSIKEGESRARILVALAPRLAEEGYLEEILVEARKFIYLSDRAKVLVELIPFLSKKRLKEILEGIRAIKENNYNTRVMIDLSKELVKEGHPQNTLELLDREDEEDRGEYLGRLAFLLAETHPSLHMLEVIWMAEDQEYQAKTLENLAARLVEAGQSEEAVKTILYIKQFSARIQALTNLTTKLVKTGHLKKALKIALRIKWVVAREQVLTNLAARLVEEGYPEEALETLLNIEEDMTKAQALLNLTHMLTEAGYLLEELKPMQFIEENHYRLNGLEHLVSRMANLPLSRLYPIWRQMLHELSNHTRQELLVDLTILAPIIFTLGGAEAMVEIGYAIMEVGQWWP